MGLWMLWIIAESRVTGYGFTQKWNTTVCWAYMISFDGLFEGGGLGDRLPEAMEPYTSADIQQGNRPEYGSTAECGQVMNMQTGAEVAEKQMQILHLGWSSLSEISCHFSALVFMSITIWLVFKLSISSKYNTDIEIWNQGVCYTPSNVVSGQWRPRGICQDLP